MHFLIEALGYSFSTTHLALFTSSIYTKQIDYKYRLQAQILRRKQGVGT